MDIIAIFLITTALLIYGVDKAAEQRFTPKDVPFSVYILAFCGFSSVWLLIWLVTR